VLKPRLHDDPCEYLATVACLATTDVRIASPVMTDDGSWVIDGWLATAWIEGRHDTTRAHDILDTSRRFYAAVASAPEPDDRATLWDIAQRIAWAELPLLDIIGDDVLRDAVAEPWSRTGRS
jgi:hypothetical protein